MNMIAILTFTSAISFFIFGISCLFTTQMKAEFKRYGLGRYRKLIGFLQIIGSLGLIVGYYYTIMIQASAALGLCILMLIGFLVRIKVKDTIFQSAPSLIFAILNGVLFLLLVKAI